MGCLFESSTVNTVDAGKPTGLEQQGLDASRDALNQLRRLTALGPGSTSISDALSSANSLSKMLDEMAKTGGLPGADDISASNRITNALFQPQEVALQQSFREQGINASREAARLGRATTDPVLQGLLRRGFMDQRAGLDATKGAAMQSLALSLPGQRLGFAQQNAAVTDALRQQALASRVALLGAGQNISNAERSLRLNTATRTNTENPSVMDMFGSTVGAIGGIAGLIGSGGSLAGLMGMGAGAGAAGAGAGAGLFGSSLAASQIPRPSFGIDFSMPNVSYFGGGYGR